MEIPRRDHLGVAVNSGDGGEEGEGRGEGGLSGGGHQLLADIAAEKLQESDVGPKKVVRLRDGMDFRCGANSSQLHEVKVDGWCVDHAIQVPTSEG